MSTDIVSVIVPFAGALIPQSLSGRAKVARSGYAHGVTRLPVPARLADVGVRMLYVLGAMAVLWYRLDYVAEVSRRLNAEGGSGEPEFWISVALAALAGVLFGLALRPASSLRGYRWGAAIGIGLPPLTLVLMFYLLVRGVWVPQPEWLYGLVFETFTLQCVLVGIAITAGLTARRLEDRRID